MDGASSTTRCTATTTARCPDASEIACGWRTGARYYVAFTNPSCPFINATVTAENIEGAGTTTSTTAVTSGSDTTTAAGSGGGGAVVTTDDPTEIDVEGSGCDCTTGGTSHRRGLGWLAAVAAVTAVSARRRRRA